MQQAKYRLRVVAPAWTGKPDPSGFGVSYTYSDDVSWLHEHAMRRARRGAQCQCEKRANDGAYHAF